MKRKEKLQKNVGELQMVVKSPSPQEVSGVEERYKIVTPDKASDKWKVEDKPKSFMKTYKPSQNK